MPRPMRTLALSLSVAAVAALVMSTAGTPTEATAAPPTGYAIGKCVDPALPAPQRPVRFDYNCDGTGVLQDMTWTTWDAAGADGTGTDVSVECQPNCAQGTKLTNPVVVHAWNPLPAANPRCPADVAFFADLTIAYPKGAPPWINPGTTWDEGTEFVTVDGMPAVHFSGLKPNCYAR